MELKHLEDALAELKTKLDGYDKIHAIDGLVLEGLPETAQNAKEAKETVDRLEAALSTLPEDIRKEVKSYLKTLPDPNKQAETDAGKWLDMAKMSDDQFLADGERPIVLGEGAAFRKSFLSPAELKQKADTNLVSGTQGALTQQSMLWSHAIVGDPWPGAGAFQMPLTAPNFKTVEASGIAFQDEGSGGNAGRNKPSNTAFDTVVGALTEASHSVKTFVVRCVISNNQANDLMGALAFIESMIRRAYGKQRGALTTAAVKAGHKAANEVEIPQNTYLAKDNAFEKLLAMAGTGSLADYWSMPCSFMLHPQDYLGIVQGLAGQGGFAMDPQTGLMRLGIWPLGVDTQAEATGANGSDKNPSWFGCWGDALVQAQLGRLTLDRFMQTIPGAVTLYSQFRFKSVVTDDEAIAAIRTGTT